MLCDAQLEKFSPTPKSQMRIRFGGTGVVAGVGDTMENYEEATLVDLGFGECLGAARRRLRSSLLQLPFSSRLLGTALLWAFLGWRSLFLR